MPGWLWFAIAIALGLVIYLLLRGRRVGARRRAPAIEYIPPDGEPLVQDQAEDQVEPVLPTTLASQPGTDGAELRHDEGYVETLPTGAGPHGWTVKGNADSMLFYTADAPGYLRAAADVWFESEETATAAGFVRWDAHHR
jgi:hypothetical protein